MPEQQHQMLRRMHAQEHISEAAVLQTCNRTECYLYAAKSFDAQAFLAGLIEEIRPQGLETWKKFSRPTSGIDVVRHLFEVAAGLDSQMLGENQVLSQLKAAYNLACQCRTSKFILHRLFHNAFRVGKAVRTRTDINCGAVSLSLAAVELAKSRLDLTNTKAMIIGAGENAELAATYLIKAGLKNLVIANRSPETADQMAERLKAGSVIALKDIAHFLGEVDLLICSTAAEQPVLTYHDAEPVLAGREQPLLIVDIAVPRDIDQAVAKFECVTLYNIDDLDRHISRNVEKRSREVPKAREIVDEFTLRFARWYESLDLVPVISRLTKQGLDLARSEAQRYAKDFSDSDAEKLRLFAESLIKKLLHGPITFLKDQGADQLTAEQLQALDLINKLFPPNKKSP